jgi:hypothetical protein
MPGGRRDCIIQYRRSVPPDDPSVCRVSPIHVRRRTQGDEDALATTAKFASTGTASEAAPCQCPVVRAAAIIDKAQTGHIYSANTCAHRLIDDHLSD